MAEVNPDSMTGSIAIAVFLQENGQYLCQISPSFSNAAGTNIQCYGQTQEHAIAIALEYLASKYRSIVEQQQNLDWDAVERNETGDIVNKPYHLIVHYERIIEGESKFEAMHDIMIGNTVVENCKIDIIGIDPDLSIEPLER
jgi:hypothetical protein